MKTFKTLAISISASLLALTLVTVGAPLFAEAATEATAPSAVQAQADEITGQEAEDIQFMVEEEKLARDVYLTLFDEWNVAVFQNISGAEQMHMDAVRTLLSAYGVDDPTAGAEIGQFTDPDLQDLYNQLVDTGSQSLADALKVGGAIEEIDILDLEERIAQTDKADIVQVYESLMAGSENHLRAFTSTLERQTGEVYAPQYMDQNAYDAILSGSNGHGNNNGGRGQGAGGAQGHGGGQGNGGGQGHSGGQGQGAHGSQGQSGSGSRDGSCLKS